MSDIASLAAEVRQQENQIARNDERARHNAAVIDACAFQLSSDISEAVKLARDDFNRAIQPYIDRMVNEYATGGSCVVRIGRSRAYPKVFVTLSINLITQRLEVSVSRVTRIGTEALPPSSFLIEVVENCVEVHDSQGFIQHSELAARLLRYFV